MAHATRIWADSTPGSEYRLCAVETSQEMTAWAAQIEHLECAGTAGKGAGVPTVPLCAPLALTGSAAGQVGVRYGDVFSVR